MSISSNLYAEKVFSEHPLALWALDDSADYVSLLTDSKRNLSSWSISGGTFAGIGSDILDEPFQNSPVFLLYGNITNDELGSIVCKSENIVKFQELNSDLATFAIGAYFYIDSIYAQSVEIGYEYDDWVTGTTVQKLKAFSSGVSKRWFFVSETFNIPDDDADVRLVFKINYLNESNDVEDYKFYLNGMSFGQWSEEFNATSLGSVPQNVSESVAVPASTGVEAFSYGLQESHGYYLVKDNSLLAKNTSIPMVYGASGVTSILPNTDGVPSLILPGQGFLNESGKFNTYTLEFWMRIVSDTKVLKRIVGPISSDDGIYVNGPMLSMKVGDNVGHHFVGEWGRPMLIDMRVIENQASLLLNGEEVISLTYLTSDIQMPSVLGSDSKNQDWIGFYSYSDTRPFEIDCVGIYTYQVSETVAKRRFVYGQGVEFPENINTAYSGTSALIDYSFAEYSNSYNFPTAGQWKNGLTDNILITKNVMSSPNYATPEILFDSPLATEESWLEDLQASQNEFENFISLRPNSSWSSINGYLFIDSVGQLLQGMSGIFGTYKRIENNTEEQVLFELRNTSTQDRLSVSISNSGIFYRSTHLGVTELNYEAFGNNVGDIFSVGIKIKDFSNYFGSNASKILGSLDQLSLYIGGNPDLNKTFTGKIYSFSICNERNFSKIADLFNSKGVPLEYENVFNMYTRAVQYDAGNDPGAIGGYYNEDGDFVRMSQSYWNFFIDGGSPTSFVNSFLRDHLASYQLVPKQQFNKMYLTVASDSYWEDYVPLTYFAKYVNDSLGDRYYSLDFLQFNINYPAPSQFIAEESTSSWTYAELENQFLSPVQRNYEALANQLFTGYDDYEDLKNRVVKNYKYDTQSNNLRSYISFQYLESGANAPYNYFTKTELVPKDGVIQPKEDWMTVKYEVVDNVIIYPPSGVDITKLGIVIHLELKNTDIKMNPIKIKSVEIAGQSLNADSSNKIGTRFGVEMFPYRKSGLYFDYKAKNPYSIYKKSSPYLYLTRNSGIELRGDHSPSIDRGISIPINSSKSPGYKISAMQTMLRYDQDFFPYEPIEIFEIQGKFVHLKFFLVATHPSGQRAKIYAVNALTGRLENGLGFFLNGKLVKEPTITIKEWAFLGISFSNTLLDMNLYVGAIRITGPLMFNNISYYESTALQEILESINRVWFQVKQADLTDLDWQFWDEVGVWNEVLVLGSSAVYGASPSDIYKSYVGTNKIIVDDNRPFRLKSYQYNVYSDVGWQSKIASAV